MPFQRRSRLTLFLTSLLLIIIIYIRTGEQRTRSSDFYTRTSEALDRAAAAPVNDDNPRYAEQTHKSQIADRLNQAERQAKQKADAKGAQYFGDKSKSEILEEYNVAQQKQEGDQEPLRGENGAVPQISYHIDGSARVGNTAAPVATTKGWNDDKKTEEEYEVDLELNSILKKGPIIIFSKTYCPHSREAKHILLEKYKITPAPYVVELDQHPLGPELQSALGGSTGRRTVPNILINGKSIGGGDEMRELDKASRLIDTVKSMGGKRIMEARLL